MSGSRHDWLDEEAAERLLSGEPVNAGNPADAGDKGRDGTPTVRALTELLTAATRSPVEQAREDAALAAFRAAREQAAPTLVGAPLPPEEPVAESSDNVVSFEPERRRRLRRLRGLSGSAKVAVAAAFAATALVGGVAAAAGTGVIPSPFSSSDKSPESTDGSQAPSLDGSEVPQAPGTDGAPSTAPTSPEATTGAKGGTGSQSPSQSPSGSGAPGAVAGANGSRPGDGDHGQGQGTWDQGSGDHDPDTLCRAYLAAQSGGGLQGNEWQWLTRDAGGQQAVDAYCRQRLGLGGGSSQPPHGTNGSGGGNGGGGNANGGNGGGGNGSGDGGNDGGRGNKQMLRLPSL